MTRLKIVTTERYLYNLLCMSKIIIPKGVVDYLTGYMKEHPSDKISPEELINQSKDKIQYLINQLNINDYVIFATSDEQIHKFLREETTWLKTTWRNHALHFFNNYYNFSKLLTPTFEQRAAPEWQGVVNHPIVRSPLTS